MVNSKTSIAEIDAILGGGRELIDRYLVTGVLELKIEQTHLREKIDAMKDACESRAVTCPGLHPERILAAAREKASREVVHTAEVTAEELENDYKTRFMWAIGSKLSYIVIAILIAAIIPA